VIILRNNLAKSGYKTKYEVQKLLSSFYLFGYTLKTKYRNLAIFANFFFLSHLANENLQNHFIFEF